MQRNPNDAPNPTSISKTMLICVNDAFDTVLTTSVFGVSLDNETVKEYLRALNGISQLDAKQKALLGVDGELTSLVSCIEAQQAQGKLSIASMIETRQQIDLATRQFELDPCLWGLVGRNLCQRLTCNKVWEVYSFQMGESSIDLTIAEVHPPVQQSFWWFFKGPLTSELVVRKLNVCIH
jgi:hypothetical protein